MPKAKLTLNLQLSGPPGKEQLKGSKAERRFSALNPHGNLEWVHTVFLSQSAAELCHVTASSCNRRA